MAVSRESWKSIVGVALQSVLTLHFNKSNLMSYFEQYA